MSTPVIAPALPCTAAMNCSGHGDCDVTAHACQCDFYWSGSDCDTPFASFDWGPWVAFVAFTAVVMSVALLGSLLSVCRHVFPTRQRDTAAKDTSAGTAAPAGPTAASLDTSASVPVAGGSGFPAAVVPRVHHGVALPTSVQRANLRDVASLLNAAAAVTRLVWLLDPISTRGVFSPRVAEALLLRLPQLLWMASFSIVVIVWSYVLTVTRVRLLSYKYLRVAVPMALGLLLIFSIPSMMLHAAKFGGEVPGDISNGAFAGYALLLAAVGSYAAYRITLLMADKQTSASIPAPIRRQLADVIRLTARTMTSAALFCAVLVIAVVLTLVYRPRPHHNPHMYFAYLVVVHVVVEGGIALTLLYTTFIPAPWLLAQWRALCCCCGCIGAGALGAAASGSVLGGASGPGGSGIGKMELNSGRSGASTPGSNSPHNSPLLSSRRNGVFSGGGGVLVGNRVTTFSDDTDDFFSTHTRSFDGESMDGEDLVMESFFSDIGSLSLPPPLLVLPPAHGATLEVPPRPTQSLNTVGVTRPVSRSLSGR